LRRTPTPLRFGDFVRGRSAGETHRSSEGSLRWCREQRQHADATPAPNRRCGGRQSLKGFLV